MKKAIIILLTVSVLLSCSESQSSGKRDVAIEQSNTEEGIAKESTDSNDKVISRLRFSIDIKSDRATIWNALWNDENYREWSSVFYEGSYYKTDSWKQGGRIMFLAPDESGIYSTIETLVPYKTVTFKHIGNVVEGKEQPVDDETKKWSGATESYSLIEESGRVTLLIEIDVLEEHKDFMSTQLPLALERIKNNCR